MVMVCGGGILPLIQGGVADLFGYMASYWVVFAALIYMLYYALIGCKNVNKNIMSLRRNTPTIWTPMTISFCRVFVPNRNVCRMT